MKEEASLGFIDFFRSIPDHRMERKKLHPVPEIMLVAFCGVIAGCESWDDIELYGELKVEHLKKYLPFKEGTPSDDTLRRFFRALDPKAFESCFTEWVRSFQLDLEDKVIAIDGKTSRRSFDGGGKPMNMVSALVSELGIVLGQQKVSEKSSEVTAIPELLDLIELFDLSGAIVTTDALGCQSKIVEKILSKGADYLLGLKGNQSGLHKDVQLIYEQPSKGMVFSSAEIIEKGHGRIETRKCKVGSDIEWLRARHPQWGQLNSIVEIESIREVKDKTSIEKRYYISSLKADPLKMLEAVRQHWGIENKLHWVLDISFGDDQSRIRKGNAPVNMAIVKKTALNLLQIIKREMPRVSLKRMRKLAGWENTFLDRVLIAKF
jgi:predicted transposase YbfD/YdcC